MYLIRDIIVSYRLHAEPHHCDYGALGGVIVHLHAGAGERDVQSSASPV